MFSDLTHHFNHPTNPLVALKNRLLLEGKRIVDLTSGNVTHHDIRFPEELLRESLAAAAASIVYDPHPLGDRTAREAISRWYAAQGMKIPVDQLLLTPGTSLSYWYAFQLLADPGDEILCPMPNYPLFDSIALMCGIRIAHYPLDETKGWRIDIEGLRRAITPKTRAIVVISPHNPTGMVASPEELSAIGELARYHRLPLIVDEVFSSFLFQESAYPRFLDGELPLLITLNGFSKMLALAGLKLGWMGIMGEPDTVATAMKGLDTISDTFLPVADPVQRAAPWLLEKSGNFQRNYQAEIKQRCHALTQALQKIPGMTVDKPAGGLYLTARLPQGIDEETVALRLLEQEGLLIYPGYFYDIPGHHVVLSCAAKEVELNVACEKLGTTIAALSR